MGWVAALFAGLLAWVLRRDLRRRETALVTWSARRDRDPNVYWAIIAVWALCLVLCAVLVLAAYLEKPACEESEQCYTIIVRTARQ